MSAKQGAALQSYNNELVKGLEELCERRYMLQADILQVCDATSLWKHSLSLYILVNGFSN